LTGCRGSSSERAPERNASTLAGDPAARSFADLTGDSGASDAGPNCTGAGDPPTGLDGGASCTGSLAASLFQYALCSCTTLSASGQLTTDGFDSTKGGPNGGLGGQVGVDTSASWSNQASIGGNFVSPGGVQSSSSSLVRSDLRLGGTLAVSAPFTVDGNAYVVKTLPSQAKVLGSVTHVASVSPPCDCTNVVPIASMVAAHRAPNNDDSSIGLSPNAAMGGNAIRIDLPCGNYYLSQINMSGALTIAVHGHTALYVDGNVNASSSLVLQIDSTATLDFFVAGALSASGAVTLGSPSAPAHCRAYVAGSSLSISAAANVDCNVYAPNASVNLSGMTATYGAVFAHAISTSGNAVVHYDTSIQNAGAECCTASKCDDGNPCTVDACSGDGACRHTPAVNGTSCPAGANKCEQSYTCQAGVCTGSNPVTCTAQDQCHAVGTCNAGTGVCSNPPLANGSACDDGNACTQTDMCQAGACTGSNSVTCTASDQCHGVGVCAPATGVCSNPALANGTVCNDGNACTQTDSCQSGACVGSNPVGCVAIDPCHAARTCDPASGMCSNPAAPNGKACDDGNACTQVDTCQIGVCTGANPIVCSASDQCHVAGACNPVTGACSNPAAANGTTCSDGNACTQSDSCQAGACVGSNPVVCSASDACHAAGVCDPASGVCSNPAVADGTSCTGSNKCNQKYACSSGACTGSNPVACPGPASQFAATASMSTARTQHAATKLGSGDVLVVGGQTQGGTVLASAEIYQVSTGHWVAAGSMNIARVGHSAALLADGRVLVAGGKDGSGTSRVEAEVYDPVANAWSSLSPMHTGHNPSHAVGLPNGRVLVTGYGTDASGCVVSSEAYDPVASSWSVVVDASNALACATGIVAGTGTGSVLVALGDGSALAVGGTLDPSPSSATAATSRYVPGSAGWVSYASMPAPRQGAVGAVLRDGHVLIAGGVGLADAVLLDPALRTWTLAGQMSAARFSGAAALLPNGAVLVTGTAAGADLYSLTSGTWSAVSGGTTRASGQTSSALSTNAILVVGGAGTDEQPVASADLFTSPDAQCMQAPSCDPSSGQCSLAPKPDGAPCSDGDLCMQAEACHAGYCVGSNPVTCTSPGSCQGAECSPSTGACVTTRLANGTSCDDGNACTQTDTCQSGACTGANPLTCTAIDACHTAGTCDPASGTCPNPAASDGTPCTGANLCNQAYACVSGTCTGSSPVVCAALDQCHAAGSCDPTTGVCSNPAVRDGTSCNDGNACTQTDTCQNGSCAGTNPVTCAASDQCHSAGTCNPSTGACSNPKATDGTTCTGSNKCNQNYACVAGTCTGSNPVSCTASDPCHSAGTCDSATGACSNPAVADGTACAGASKCNQTYACVSGACTGSNPVACTASDPCHSAGTCDPATGTCSNPAVADGTACAGISKCNQAYACVSGACTGSNPVACTASDQCHVAGTCDPATGGCSNPAAPDGATCNDGNACTQTDSCQSGVCTGSNPVVCTASDQCRVAGTCDPTSGACSNPAVPDGTSCTGSDKCSQFACHTGSCTGTPIACTALDVCHVAGTCDSATGSCSNPPNPSCPPGLPPDPRVVAPPLDRTVVTTTYNETQFLYTGTYLVQTGVSAGTIDPVRVCELHGQVQLDDGTAEPGVVITVVAHPEFGQTMSRADGRFDLVVNGGGPITLDYAKSSFLPVQRTVTCGWQTYATVPTVVVIPPDPNVTSVTFGSSAGQVARGSVVTDPDGTRQATCFIPPGTTAQMVKADGTTAPLSTGSLRITEYTVGPNGDKRMPAELPPTSAYTYAFEVGADEAASAGATSIQLSQPASCYTDNFLNFPVGIAVPLGSYTRACSSGACATASCGTWSPSSNGAVIQILSVTGGVASVDIDGSGTAASSSAMAAMGITRAELQILGQLYAAGHSFWRMPLPHFTPWDANWGFGPPPDFVCPNAPPPLSDVSVDCHSGSIDAFSQTVNEIQPITGTLYHLVYQSDRVLGGRQYTVPIPVTGATIPASLKRVDLEVTVAGTTSTQSFAAAPNLSFPFQWNDQDAFGRALQGRHPINVHETYVYDGFYHTVAKFGARGNGLPIQGSRTRREITCSRDLTVHNSALDEAPVGLGGWNLDVHHTYDPGGAVYLGDGTTRTAERIGPVVKAFAGAGPTDAVSATTASGARFGTADALAAAPDGSVYITDQYHPAIYRVSPSGAMVRVAGTGTAGYNGDEIAATQAQIDPYYGDIALARECDGGFYFADTYNRRVRYVDAKGIIHTVAGDGGIANPYYSPTGNNVPATQTSFTLAGLGGVAVAPDGGLYLVDLNLIAHVGKDGLLTWVAGTARAPNFGSPADGIPALQALIYPFRVLAAPDGSIYMLDAGGLIRRIGTDGIINTVAGGGAAPFSEGISARSVNMFGLSEMALGGDGTLYFNSDCTSFAGCKSSAIFSLTPDGRLYTAVGNNFSPYGPRGTGGPALQAGLAMTRQFSGLALAPDGSLYFSEVAGNAGGIVRRTSVPPLAGLGIDKFLVGSDNGREAFVFNGDGRHVQTLDALTGAVRYQFAYDSGGRLSSVADGAGNLTTIQRDSAGLPVAIVSPYGQTTALATDGRGFLASISNPAAQAFAMTYSPSQPGLLASFTDPTGRRAQFTYDAAGRLTRVDNGAGGLLTLSEVLAPAQITVNQSTGLGVTSTFLVQQSAPSAETRTETLPNGLLATRAIHGGTIATTLPSGLASVVTQGADPLLGMASPYAAMISVTAPSGLNYQQTTARAETPTSIPLVLSNRTDTTRWDAIDNSGAQSIIAYSSGTTTWTTPAQRKSTQSLDTLGRLSSAQRAGLLAQSFAYDARGRLSSITQGSRTRSYGYDNGGLLAQVTDPLSQVTAFARDGAGRVVSQTLPDRQVAGFGYDAAGHLSSIVPPQGAAHTFTYGPTGQVATYVAPALSGLASTTTSYSYDADTHLTNVTQPDGSAITVSYDSAGRTSAIALPTGTIGFSYDPKTGRIGAATAGGETLVYGYDGILPTGLAWSGPVRGSVSWIYDRYMKLVSEEVNGQSGISFAYDGDGLLTQAGAMTLTWDSNALLTATSVGGVSDSIGYDNFGARTSYSAHYNTTAIFAASYTRDALGRITAKTETVQGTTHSYTYRYDARGRLTDVARDGASVLHAGYDANGNRTGLTTPGGAIAAIYDGQDRLLSQGTVSYAYGPSGDLQSKTDQATGKVTAYVYDALGNLVHVALPSGHAVDYIVDAAGRRVAKAKDGVIERQWLYRDGLRPVAELDGDGNVIERYVYADKRLSNDTALDSLQTRLGIARLPAPAAADRATPVYVVRAAQTLRVITDPLGSPRLVVDTATGAVVQALDYDAWGTLLSASGADVPSLNFAGGLYDSDTGLVHFGARDYDPQAARFFTKEPMKASGALNFYAYAGGDPVNNADADGLAKAAAPEQQAVLDSLCGPTLQGETICLPQNVTDPVAASGAIGGSDADTTTQLPGTDLPTFSSSGDSSSGLPTTIPNSSSASTSGGPTGTGTGGAPVNQPPQVSINPPAITVTMPANNVALNGTATDDGLWAPLQVLWFTQSGPAQAEFANAASAATTASFPLGGVYVLALSANDGSFTRTATVTVTVNQPPIVTATGPGGVAVGDTPTYVATVTEPVPGKTLTFAWTSIAGPGTVTFAAPAAQSTTASFSAPGSYTLQFEATDGTLTSFANVPVNVFQVDQAPVVSVGPNQNVAAPTMIATLTGSASDDGVPAGVNLTSTWTLLSGPAQVTIAAPTQSAPQPGPLAISTNVAFSYPGTYVFQLAVSDTAKVTTATTTVTVSPPNATNTSAPTVALGGITDDALVTKPVPITATISEGSWELERRLGGRDDVTSSWSVMASGTGAVAGGTLATFDPTLLLNGVYTVRLSATTSAGSSSTSVSVSVDGRMKVGNFTLAFTDLDVAVAGIPFTLTRAYDSRDKGVGDFGVGWNLAIRDVRVEKSGKTGAYWTQVKDDSGFFPQYCLEPARATTVTVTFPSGRQYRFRAKSSPECQALEPLTTPDIIWESTSDPNNPTVKLVAQGGTSVFTQSAVGPVQLLTASLDIWDPHEFTLTTEDGTQYQISQDQGITQIVDRKLNSLTITPQGILHSSGKQVTFTRDTQNRITTITDPAGQSMTYGYDADGDLASYTDRAGNTTQFAYAGNHYLQSIQDPLGRQPIRNDYDASGRLLSNTDATGHTVSYSHNLAANQEQVTDRLGHITLYTYNDRGDITQKTDATGAVWKYTFDVFGNKLSETDPLGHTASTTYDGQNAPLTQTDALGNVTTNTYNSFRQLLTTTDPLGKVTKNVYDGPLTGTGDLSSTTDPTGAVTTYTYCGPNPRGFCPLSKGQPVTRTDPLGNVTRYAYDAAGNTTSMTDALGNVTTYSYDANGKKTGETIKQTINGAQQTLTTSYQYDAAERLLKTTYPDGTSTSSTYSPISQRLTSTDELGRVTAYTYDEIGRLVTTTRPDATAETQTYDAENRRLTSTDPAGNTTRFAYDNVGRLTNTKFADGSSSSTSYDAAGRALSSTDELGHTIQTSYDAAGRNTSSTDPTGAVIATGYDAAGNITSTTDPLGHTTLTTHDADNRTLVTTYVDGTSESMSYDGAGRMVSKTDPLGRVTKFAYDGVGRLIAVTDALGRVTQYAYDEVGHRVSQTDANGHTTSFAYDSRGRETARTLPDGSSESKAYDAAGEIVKRTDFMGKATVYAYDSLGRLLSRTYPDASVVSFTYTPDGRRATEVDPRGTTTYAYDARRRLVQETVPDGRALSFAYDAHGERTGLTAKLGTASLTTTTSYDAAGRPSQVTDPIGRNFALTYDANGDRTSLQYPNTTGTSYTYDALNRLTNLITRQAPPGPLTPLTVQSYAYTLDAAGKRTGIVENDGTTRRYAYDGIDRLTSEMVTGSLSYAKTFAYDPVGNRLTQTTSGTGAANVNYAYDSRDRLSSENSTNYSYDANGNVTSKSGEASYTWDFENRLTEVATVTAPTATSYDADGNRMKTVVTPLAGGPPTVCSGNSATFVRNDAATQGSWMGAYGADGQYINAESPAPPAYGSVTFAGASNFTWTANTTDVRALQQPAPQTSRIASTYYNATAETLHVVTTDNNVHTIALYFLDWDNLGRGQTVTAQSPSGTAFDSGRAFAGFSGGLYAVYTICGSVDFTLTRTAGPNAVVSGVFFGTPGPPTMTNYLVDTSGGLSQVVAETDGNGNLTAYYVRVGDELLAVMRPGATAGTWSTRFVHNDGLGSVRALTDESGTTIDSRAYEAFGTKNVEAGNDPLAYGFTGEPFEPTSKLAYHRARWMDARVGRFEGMDSFEGVPDFPPSLHRYAYANSNPANEIDPSGLISPLGLLFGRQVHQVVSLDWVSDRATTTLRPPRVFDQTIDSLVGGAKASFWSNLTLKRAFGVGAWARPDLAATTDHVIMEIKSIDEFGQGQAKVYMYLNLLNELDPKNTWTAGTADQYTPIPTTVVFDTNVEISPPENGVITYTPSPSRRQLQSLAVNVTAVFALVAVTTVVATATLGVAF
jgi:RHS repeat-associated protein